MHVTQKPVRATLSASLLMLGLLVGASAQASEGAKDGQPASCKEEVRKVAVWAYAANPKTKQSPRFEDRLVTVCDGKVVKTSTERSASVSSAR